MNDLTFNRPEVDQRVESRGASPEVAGEPGRESQPLLVHYLNIAKRRKWLLMGAIAVAVIAGLIVTLLMTPQYTARSTLEIKREGDRIVNVEGVEPKSGGVDLEFYQTQWGLLRSQTLAERVATDLRLHEDPAFFEMFGADEPASQLREGVAAAGNATQRQVRIRLAGEILLKHVNVVPERLSRLVHIDFTSPDPSFSARISNAWTRHFIEISLARRFDATSYARRFLEDRLEQLRRRLQDSERMLVAYAANQRIINIPAETTSGSNTSVSTTERPLVAEDLSALNRELNEAIAARVAAQSRLHENGGATTEALSNQAISELRTRRAALAAEYRRLMTQFEPDYPPAQALTGQIAELDRAIAREEGRVRATLQNNFQAASARESMLRQRVGALQSELLDLRGRTIQYNIYQREVDTNRQLYDALLQRYKEIGVAGGVGVNNISVVDPAQVPDVPSSPNLILNMLVSLILGGLLGAAIALALEQVDETLSDPRDLETALGLPLLGTIPKSESENPVEELEDRKAPMVEAFLSTQTRLAFTTDHGVPRTLMVTSTRPGEGKTTTAYALARSLARTSRRVIIVDADMRSPSLHHVFGLENNQGLSNYLSGSENLATMIRRDTPSGVALLSAGPRPPNAAELLTGERISQLLKELVQMFDHVILDAPPVMGLADTPLMGSLAEGVIFVVESHETRLSMARVAINRLRDARARVLGALLTKFEAKRAHYGYGYEYGYGYGETERPAA